VQQDALPVDVVAATKVPGLFVTPAEMDLACFLLNQQDFKKAEKLLLETLLIQEKAQLKESTPQAR